MIDLVICALLGVVALAPMVGLVVATYKTPDAEGLWVWYPWESNELISERIDREFKESEGVEESGYHLL